jgi:hypothetical protein
MELVLELFTTVIAAFFTACAVRTTVLPRKHAPLIYGARGKSTIQAGRGMRDVTTFAI